MYKSPFLNEIHDFMLTRRYSKRTVNWQYLFPAVRLSVDPETGFIRRHHMDESMVNKRIKKAGSSADIRTVQ